MGKIMVQETTVGNLMSRSPATIAPDARLTEVVHQMQSLNTSCLVVVDGRQPVGMVSERDLVRILGDALNEKCSKSVQAAEFMSSPPVTVTEATSLFDALVIAQSRNIRHLPVVDANGLLAGILSYTNLAYAYEHVIERHRLVIEQEVQNETRALRDANEQLKALSMEDALLRVGNRRAMEVDLLYTHNTAMRYNRPYSIVLFDIDYFKQYNDHYGHQAGDEVLKLVTEHIRCSIRKSDRLYRYGGEELLLLLPETKLDGAKILAERIIDELAERNIPHAESDYHVVTMSGGIGSPMIDGNPALQWSDVVGIADRGLYRAKQTGRNCVHIVLETETAH